PSCRPTQRAQTIVKSSSSFKAIYYVNEYLTSGAKIHINYDNSMILNNISAERNSHFTDFALSLPM
ncbi:MAG: hypothetical protein IKS64_01560, partial [Muribaculaceae bacterium]|nr:hypothetical protein [Muribaculaceae bacterium]